MVFDKTKAMRNAERYVAQGKIQSAIAEYKQVVANDPKDFGTLNMLGDMYAKNSEKASAVKCYTSVAEHYSRQGFAQKAIALYNKISKLQPGSIEISAKLAELYKSKGAVNEARVHYKTVAEHFESQGKKIEALEIRKEIAALDPTDTAIQLSLAAAYVEEHQTEQAVEAFVEAGTRFVKRSDHSGAIDAFEKALELVPADQKALSGFTQAHFALGTASVAADRLSQILSAGSHNSDVLLLLIRLDVIDHQQVARMLVEDLADAFKLPGDILQCALGCFLARLQVILVRLGITLRRNDRVVFRFRGCCLRNHVSLPPRSSDRP